MLEKETPESVKSGGVDEAMDLVMEVGAGESIDIDEHALVKKIDWRIVPIMFLCYLMQFIDKVLINYANVMGISKSLGLKGNDFSWMATSFFLAYFVAEFPQGYLLQRYPIAKVLGVNIFLWGVTVICTSAVQNFAGLVAVRVLLGCFEAVIAPSLVLITSMWYKKQEAAPRMGIWYCGLGCGQILGGILSFAFQHITSKFEGWRVMFIVLGVVNLFIAALVLMFLPSTPMDASFLTHQEKVFVVARLSTNQTGIENKTIKKSQLREALTDLQVWLLCLMTLLISLPSGAITTYSSTLIRGFGYTSKQAALLNMPSGIVSIVSTLVSTWAIGRGAPRWQANCILVVPVIIGGGLMGFLPHSEKAGLLAGIYLINTIVAPLAIVFSLVGSNVAGHTKKVAANAMVSMAFGISNIIGPQTFQARDAPGYIPAKITILVAAALVFVLNIILRLVYGARNAGRNSGQTGVEAGKDGAVLVNAWSDMTDKENRAFRYVY